MSGGLVTVGEFGDRLQAELFQMRLEQEGIKAVIVGDVLMTGLQHEESIHVDVQVCQEDEKKALELLEVYLDECDANEGEDIGDEDEDDAAQGGSEEGE